MSVVGLKPTFTDREGWRGWKAAWRVVYARLTVDIRAKRKALVLAQRQGDPDAPRKQRDLHFTRAMARKMLDVRLDALARLKRMEEMEQQIADQMASFPLVLEDCKTVDFHFNKGSNEWPQLPMWVVKAKGRTFYVHHVTATVPWSTRETPDGSTRGMIRFRAATLRLTAEGEAVIE